MRISDWSSDVCSSDLVDATRAAVRAMLDSLRNGVLDQYTLDSARQPLLENHENLLKTPDGWMTLADRAQSEADCLDSHCASPRILKTATPTAMTARGQPNGKKTG